MKKRHIISYVVLVAAFLSLGFYGGVSGSGVVSSAFTADGEVLVGTGPGTYAPESGATLRTSIGAYGSGDEDAIIAAASDPVLHDSDLGGSVQAYDADILKADTDDTVTARIGHVYQFGAPQTADPGNAAVGDVITVAVASWDPAGLGGAINYRIRVTALSGTDIDTFVLLDDDAGNSYSKEWQIQGGADVMADDNYNGITLGGKSAGSNVTQWNPVFLAADGKYDNADADAALYPAFGLAVACSTGSWPCADTEGLTILLQGVVRNEGWTGLTVGGAVYLSDAPATTTGITQTPPAISTDCVQIIGWALSDSEIYFDFSRPYQLVE